MRFLGVQLDSAVVQAAAGSLNQFATDGSFMEQFAADRREGGNSASGASDSDRHGSTQLHALPPHRPELETCCSMGPNMNV